MSSDMESNKTVDVSGWVDERLAQLATSEKWQPDVSRGLARFHERISARHRRRLILIAAALSAAGFCLLLWVGPRQIAQNVLDGSRFKLVDIGQVSADVKALKDGQAAPDFALKGADGRDLRLSGYKGKVVLLNFWATWCHGCKLEIPWLLEFQKKYQNRGFTVIGVAMDAEGWKNVKPFLQETKLNYPVVVGNDEMAKPWGLGAMPMTFLIDREGKVSATSVGIINRAACETQIVELLGSSRR